MTYDRYCFKDCNRYIQSTTHNRVPSTLKPEIIVFIRSVAVITNIFLSFCVHLIRMMFRLAIEF